MLLEGVVLTYFGRKIYPWKSLAYIAYHLRLLQQNNSDKTAKFIFILRFFVHVERPSLCLEQFSFEYRKTKTKTKAITLANHKGHRQYSVSEPIKTRSNYM